MARHALLPGDTPRPSSTRAVPPQPASTDLRLGEGAGEGREGRLRTGCHAEGCVAGMGGCMCASLSKSC